MELIRVFIVDDHEVVRLGLRGLFQHYDDIDVVGEASTGEEAIQIIPAMRPDVVLMDVRLPGISGIDACRLLRAAIPELHVVFLSSFAEAGEVQAAFKAGGIGYVLKNITSVHVISAIKSAMRNQTFVDPEITAQVMKLIRREDDKEIQTLLTKREEDIIMLVAQGKTNREIGSLLYLSEKTVRNHVSKILGKLGLSNRSQAAAYVVRRDILIVPENGK
jgi:two-component system, NarL family, response regulator DevR